MLGKQPKKPRLSLTKTQIQVGIGAELLVLCQSVTEDGSLSKDEIIALKQWLDTNRSSDLPAIGFLRSTLERIIADGKVTKDERTELYKAIEACIAPAAWDSTVPLVLIRGRTLHQFGTATLFRVGDDSFLVTAAHVIKQAHENRSGLCAAVKNGSFIALDGQWMCSKEGQYGTTDDPFDIGVLPLIQSVALRFEGSVFLRLDDVCFEEDMSKGIFCVVGFPSLWSQSSTESTPTLTTKALQYTTYVFEGSTEDLANYQARFHLLLGANLMESTDRNGDPVEFSTQEGTPAAFPKQLGGISGGSVWKIGDRMKPIRDWKSVRPRIIAVEASVYPDRQIIKTTRWVGVSTLLHSAFPHLRPAMLLWRVG